MSTRKKALLIDDDHGILDLLEVFLFEQYEIITALNGFEGLTIAQEQMPDLIITDIMMPVMDGIKFLNTLRRRPEAANIPVIAVTSFTKKMNEKSLVSVGFKAVVFKPLNREAVLEALKKAFGEAV
jgi:two-component system, sensor histidine kinase and response regulator